MVGFCLAIFSYDIRLSGGLRAEDHFFHIHVFIRGSNAYFYAVILILGQLLLKDRKLAFAPFEAFGRCFDRPARR